MFCTWAGSSRCQHELRKINARISIRVRSSMSKGAEGPTAAIKDILVHLDGRSTDELRLQHAEAIAATSQAHLTGLFMNSLADDARAAPLEGSAMAARVMPSSTGKRAVTET
jgi:hypothetical protein